MSKIITFDFDRTLCLVPREENPFTGKSIPFDMVIEQYRIHQNAGHSMNILTTRLDATMQTVHDFVAEFNLKPDNIWNTNFKLKGRFLKENSIHVDHHYDDNPEEFAYMKKHLEFQDMGMTLVYSDIGQYRFIDYNNQTDKDKRDIWRYIRG